MEIASLSNIFKTIVEALRGQRRKFTGGYGETSGWVSHSQSPHQTRAAPGEATHLGLQNSLLRGWLQVVILYPPPLK